ncbi:MAG: alpha-galactosidase [Clostridiales bacterium]|nr:MAG: alpha-galactosidase [Clostridiales bacterium]
MIKQQLPPMGWNSYCTVNCDPTEELILEHANLMASNGLRDAGYVYVNIDDGWMEQERDKSGKLVTRADRFPHGMKYLTDKIHSLGMKAGIYLGCGVTTWHEDAGSLGYEFEDAKTIAEMGFDYLKYDRHPKEGDPVRDTIEEYVKMGVALENCGRDIVYNLCEHGTTKPWLWAYGVGQLWRTGFDVRDIWDGANGLMTIVDKINQPISAYAGVSHYNDPDMLVVGMHCQNDWMGAGCSDLEYRSIFALWCMMAAPLLIGLDIRRMDHTAKSILTNKHLIAVNQDTLCMQGRVVRSIEGKFDIWVKPLSNVRWAVGLFNRATDATAISFTAEDLGMTKNIKGSLLDVWTEKTYDLEGEFSTVVEGHEMKTYIFEPKF